MSLPKFYDFHGSKYEPHMDDELFTFLNTEPLERKRREIRELRQASEHNREIIADNSLMGEAYRQRLRTKTPASQFVYYTLHHSYFAKSPQRMQNADSGLLESREYVYKRGTRDFYEKNVGKHRTNHVSVGGLPNLAPKYMSEIERLFFSTVDSVNESSLKNPHEVLYFLAFCDLVELMCHFPFDVSGRTDEDFLVWLAHGHGVDMTISRTGYRGFVEDDIIEAASDVRIALR